MSAAIVLPARLASTRLANKLLLDRTGKTVLEHTIERALDAQRAWPKLFTSVLVACDDEKLMAAAKRSGAKAVMTRADHQSGTDRIAEAAQHLSEEIIVNLQADEPEMDPENLKRVAEALVSAPDSVPMATLACPILDFDKFNKFNVVKVVVDRAWRALYFSRAPIPHVRDEPPPLTFGAFQTTQTAHGSARCYGLHHLGMYAYRKTFLMAYSKLPPSDLEQLEKLEQLRVLENGHAIQVAPAHSHPPGIDTPDDYEAFVARKAQSKVK